jgi:CRISPR/Cas system CSM-associated protein Csm3 (group 7 of RAMP superfamily)
MTVTEPGIRTVLRLTVELTGPWLVGDPTGTGELDTVPLREPDGSPQVPATSLAGSLRDHLRRWPGVAEQDWMGERRGRDDDRGAPSRLRVLGVRLSGGGRSSRRTTTAVCAWTGSARRATLRREEYIDAPTALTVYLAHPGEPDPVLTAAIAGWQPVVGRRRTHGWGRATITEFRYGRVDLRDREQLLAWLAGGGPSLVDTLATVPVEPRPDGSGEDLVSVRCRVVDGLHIGTGEPVAPLGGDGAEPDRATPVAGTVIRDGAAYVPAASWRGVFRAHAGFVLRSLGLPDHRTDEWTAELFGSCGRRGQLTFHDAALSEPASDDHWHVGIDRITGGARPGLLFGERTVRGTLRLRISADRPEEIPGWTRSVLWHTVRDIADGYLAVGGRTTRGLGTLAVLDPLPAVAGIDLGPAGGGAGEGEAR